MKRNKMMKLIIAVLMFIVMLTPLLGSSLATYAVNEPAGTGQPDTTSERSLTIWKYEIDNMSQAGDRGDGTFTPDPSRTPLAGVQFRITRVESAGNVSLTNPLTQEGQWTTAGTPIYVVTDGDGRAHHSFGMGNGNDGIYLIEEIINPALIDQTVTRAVDPFFVHIPMTRRTGEGAGSELIYEVHVHPKNVVTTPMDLEKTLRGNDALYGEGTFFNSWIAGTPFWWDLTTNVPRDLVRGITEPGTFTRTTLAAPYVETVTVTREMIDGSDFFVESPTGSVRAYPLTAVNFEISDRLDSALLINDYQMWAYQSDREGAPGTWVQLQEGVHFIMSMNLDNENDVTFTLTDEGMIFVDGEFSRIRVSINVESQEDFNGVIINTFDVRYLGPDWEIAPFEESSNQAVYFTGGNNFIKLSRASGSALEGAIFHIAISQEDAAAGRFLASDGNSYLYTDSLPMGVTFLVAWSDQDGLFGFNGLPLDANGFAIPVNEPLLEELWRDFFVVETTAPIYTDAEGRVFTYELLGAPVEVRVTPFTHLEDDVRAVYNDRSTDLPFTGGMGTAFLVIIAIIVIGIGTTAFVVDRKRRNA